MIELQARPGRRTHPIVEFLHERGSTVAWLARRLKMNRTHTSLVVHGRRPANARFRASCADVLGVPQDELFHTDSPAEKVA